MCIRCRRRYCKFLFAVVYESSRHDQHLIKLLNGKMIVLLVPHWSLGHQYGRTIIFITGNHPCRAVCSSPVLQQCCVLPRGDSTVEWPRGRTQQEQSKIPIHRYTKKPFAVESQLVLKTVDPKWASENIQELETALAETLNLRRIFDGEVLKITAVYRSKKYLGGRRELLAEAPVPRALQVGPTFSPPPAHSYSPSSHSPSSPDTIIFSDISPTSYLLSPLHISPLTQCFVSAV